MNEENKNPITYDDDWQSVSLPEYPKINGPENNAGGAEPTKSVSVKNKASSPRQLVVIFQLIVCMLAVCAAFVLSAFGGDAYQAAHEWYYANLNKSVIFEADGNTINFSNLFGATHDEVSSVQN